jgi:hypothetical protein
MDGQAQHEVSQNEFQKNMLVFLYQGMMVPATSKVAPALF